VRSVLLASCLTMLVFVSAANADLVTDGLVSYYTLDKDDIADKAVKDIIGGKNGTIVGAPKSIPGHLGEALDFAGEPDSVQLPPILKVGENPVSYECWFMKTETAGWQYLIVNKTDFSDNFFRLGFNQNTGQVRMYTEQNNNERLAFVTPDDYADGQWHHVVATREGSQGRIYVDGELVKEDVAMEGDLGGDKTNWFLAQNGGNKAGEYLIGAMDEVRIYNRALTEEEVKQNFESKGMAAVDSKSKLATAWGMIKGAI
jgi:hypothetical protein